MTMSHSEPSIDKELFLEKFEKLSLKVEQLTDEISKLKNKLDKDNKINRSFGLKVLRNSQPLEFAKEILGIGSPTKRYLLTIRAISEEWKGRKNDFLISIQQQEMETHLALKSLGIRIPINDVKNLRILSREVLSLLYIACEFKGIEITDLLREILQDINKSGPKMVQEIRNKLIF
jgi:hypothetical protein